MNDDAHPKRIDEVEQIRDLDLSPFVLSEIEWRTFRLKPTNPISLLPVLTDDEQFLCLEHAPWSLDVFATNRAELLAELKEQMLMLWQEYAREQDDVLSEPAQQVKQQLLADWEETAHGTRRETLTQRTVLSRHFIEEDRQPGLHHAGA